MVKFDPTLNETLVFSFSMGNCQLLIRFHVTEVCKNLSNRATGGFFGITPRGIIWHFLILDICIHHSYHIPIIRITLLTHFLQYHGYLLKIGIVAYVLHTRHSKQIKLFFSWWVGFFCTWWCKEKNDFALRYIRRFLKFYLISKNVIYELYIYFII